MYPKTKLNPVYKLIKSTKEAGYTPDPNSLKRKIVSNLPSTGIEDNCIYMVYDSKDGKKGNTYNEYMYTEGKWELLGPTKTNGGGGDVSTLLIEVEYDDLVDIRDNKQLIPGCLYRITDYVTKGGDGKYFGSHEHPFDVIVLALSADTLSEDAMAIHHEGEIKDAFTAKMFVDGDLLREIPYIFNGTKQTIEGVEYFVAVDNDGESPNAYSTTTKPTSSTEVYMFFPPFGLDVEFISFQEEADHMSQEIGQQCTCTITPEEIIDKGYFKHNNLAAWELKYRLDNDQNYEWACRAEETEELHINVCTSFQGSINNQGLVGKNSTYQNEKIILTDDNITSDPSWEAYLFEALLYDKTQCKLFNLPEGKTIYCAHLESGESEIVTSKLVFYDGENREIYILYDNPSSANMESYYYVEPDEYEDYIGYFTSFDPYTETVVGKNPGKGLIYYMKDEFGNEAPYDFKNFGNLVKGGGGQTKSFSAQADILGDNNEVIPDAYVDFEYVDDPLNDSSDPSTRTLGIVRNTKAPKEDEEGEDPDYDAIDAAIRDEISKYISMGYRWFRPTIYGNPVKLVNEVNDGSNQVVCDYILAYIEVSPKENDGDENNGGKTIEKSQKSDSQNRERRKVKFSVADINASMHQNDISNTKGPSSKITNEIKGFGGFSRDSMILLNGSIVTMAEAGIQEGNMINVPLSDLYHLPSKKADPTVSPSSDTIYDVVVDDLLLYTYNIGLKGENPEDASLNIESTYVADVKIIYPTFDDGYHSFPDLIFSFDVYGVLVNSTFKNIEWVTFCVQRECSNNYFNDSYPQDEEDYIINLNSAYNNIFNPGMTIPLTIDGDSNRIIQNNYTTLQNKPYVVLDNGYTDLDELIANYELIPGTVYDLGGGEFAIATSNSDVYIVQGTQYTPQP